MTMNKRFLVELCLKRWMAPFPDGTHICGYAEVAATDEYGAMLKGFAKFPAQCKKDVTLQKRLAEREVNPNSSSVYASCAVEI